MRFSILALATVCCASFLSCDPAAYFGPQFRTAKQADLRVSYHQDACFGTCEVFGLDVYETGLLIFRGERFTDRPGAWQRNIDRRRVTAFLDSLKRLDFTAYPRSFPSRIPDLPTTTITYRFPGSSTPVSVSFREQSTPELTQLAERLQQLAALPGYRPVPEASTQYEADRRDELIVHLKPGADAGAWVVKYSKQGVSLGRRVTPNGSYYMVAFDPATTGADELLNTLRTDPEVISAQRNGAASPR